MKNLDNFIIYEKNVLFRADLNVPSLGDKVLDTSRIESIKSSIQKLSKKKNKIFIISHFRRPNGKIDKRYSLKFICPFLEKILEVSKIHFLENINKDSIKEKTNQMSFGEICLLENIRFFPEEEKNDNIFAKNFSSHFDVYVNDAFSASHRNHASIVGFGSYLPAVAGDYFLNELKNINMFIENVKKPNIAIIGGSKISTKINLLNNLIKIFNTVVLGGAMANTFLLSKNISIGDSMVEKDLISKANEIQENAIKLNCKLILPIDFICSKDLKDQKSIKYCNINNIPPKYKIFDIGNKTIKYIHDEIIKSQMLIWNGPLGAFEYQPFEKGTAELANIIKNYSKKKNFQALAGGGDTISFIKNSKSEDGFTYISNSGGAFLEWLEGKESPGVKALRENIF